MCVGVRAQVNEKGNSKKEKGQQEKQNENEILIHQKWIKILCSENFTKKKNEEELKLGKMGDWRNLKKTIQTFS